MKSLTLLGCLCLCAGQNLTFGQSSVLTGPSRDLGINLRDGTIAAFRSVNDAGGIFGRNLSLHTLDDLYEPLPAYNNTQTFLNQKVIAALSYCGTATTLAAVNLTLPARVPMIAPFTGARAFRKPTNRYVINTRAAYDDEIGAFVQFCVNKSRTVFSIFYQADAFGQAGVDALTLALANLNLKILSEGNYVPNSFAVEVGLAALEQSQLIPEVIVMIGTAAPLAKFVSLAQLKFPDAYYYSVSFLGSEAFLEALHGFTIFPSVAQNIYVSQVFPIPKPLSQLQQANLTTHTLLLDFASAMNVSCPGCNLTFGALEGYVAGNVVSQVFRKMGPLDATITNPFRKYLDRAGETPGIFDLTRSASLAAVREYFLDTLFFTEIVNVGGLRLGPYVTDDDNCVQNSVDCIQSHPEACMQGMHNVYLTQPNLTSDEYTEILDWRVSWFDCDSFTRNSSTLPVIFGQSAALTGPTSELGTNVRAGILSAFHEANISPSLGVRGRPLLLMSFDDAGDPDQAIRNANHMLNNQSILGLVGSTRTPTSLALLPMFAAADIPFVGPVTGNRALYDKADIINVRPGYDDEVASAVDYGVKQGWTKFSVLQDDGAFGLAGIEALQLAMSWHKSSVYSTGVFNSTLDFTAALASLSAGGAPDVLFLFASANHSASFAIIASATAGWENVKYVFSSLVGVELIQAMLPPALLSSGRVLGIAVVPLHNSSSQITQSYLAALNKFDKNAVATYAGMEGYVIGRLIVWALQRAVDTTAAGLQHEIFGLVTSFLLDDVRLGPYVLGGCTMGLRDTYVLRLATTSVTQLSVFRAKSMNPFANDCGTASVFLDPPCPSGYRKQYVEPDTLQSTCELCLAVCYLPEFVPNLPVRQALTIFNGIGCLLAILVMIVVIKYRNAHTLKASSPRFCILILVGATVGYSTIFLLYSGLNAENCMAQVYMFNTAFAFFFGALFTKIYRITRIFGEHKLFVRIVRLKDSFLFALVSVLWTVEMIFSLTWHLVDPMVLHQDVTTAFSYYSCRSKSNNWGAANILCNALFLVYGIILTIQSRNTPTAFNESKFLAATLYNAFIVGSIFIGLAYSSEDDDRVFLCKALSVLLICTIGICFLFGPKFYVLYLEVYKGKAPKIETSRSGSSNNMNMRRDTNSVMATSTMDQNL